MIKMDDANKGDDGRVIVIGNKTDFRLVQIKVVEYDSR